MSMSFRNGLAIVNGIVRIRGVRRITTIIQHCHAHHCHWHSNLGVGGLTLNWRNGKTALCQLDQRQCVASSSFVSRLPFSSGSLMNSARVGILLLLRPIQQSQDNSFSTRVIKPVSVNDSRKRKRAGIRSTIPRWKPSEGHNEDIIGLSGSSLTRTMHKIDELNERADVIEANLNKLGSLHTAIEAEREQLQDLMKVSRMVRYKTIERKYFRKPHSLNLLTWAAKEQMRHLHFHEDWSVEELADHYPVSIESVRKILKSRIRLHRNENIRSHDQDVRNNWQKVRSMFEGGGDLSGIQLEDLMNSESDLLVKNAVGLEASPLPQPVGPQKAKGAFSMIVKDCLDNKVREHKEKMKSESEKRHAFSEELDQLTFLIRKTMSESELPPKSKLVSPSYSAGREKSLPVQRESGHEHLRSNGKKEMNRNIVIKADIKRSDSLTTYQQGDCVYNSRGEFLYRIP